MQQGSIKLSSGPWDWRLRPQQSGSAVVFHHRQRSQDEMRTWAPETALSASRARELALDPVERLWLDADGLLWNIHVELPSDWARSHSGQEGALRLVFTCGSNQKSIWVPEDTRLGELAHFDLSRLFTGG